MNNYEYPKKSKAFKKGFLIWGVGSLITIYVFLRLIFGTGEGIRFLGDASESSMEKDILKIALCEHKVFDFGKVEFIGVITVSEFYKVNHLFYVSNYPGVGPAFVLIQTPEYFSENPFINEFSIFPFLPYSSEEGLSYIKQQFKGYDFKTPSPKEALLRVLKIRSGLEVQNNQKVKLASSE